MGSCKEVRRLEIVAERSIGRWCVINDKSPHKSHSNDDDDDVESCQAKKHVAAWLAQMVAGRLLGKQEPSGGISA